MVVIHLYGVLEEVAQRVVRLHASSFDDSMKGLLANFPKLGRVLRDMRVSILVNDRMIEFEDCLRPMDADRIDIVPIVGGTGPAIFIIAGVALSYGAEYIAGLAVGTFLAGYVTEATVASFGMSLILGGVSQLLIHPPSSSAGSAAADSASFSFNGSINVTNQGNIVPVGYGRLRVGSTVISANIQTWDIPIGPITPATVTAPPANPVGPFNVDPLPSGEGGP